MRERFGHDVALCPLLDLIVADRRSGAESRLEVARLELAAALCEIAPDAGVAIGLQLEADR
jgi:hypothetical protein